MLFGGGPLNCLWTHQPSTKLCHPQSRTDGLRYQMKWAICRLDSRYIWKCGCLSDTAQCMQSYSITLWNSGNPVSTRVSMLWIKISLEFTKLPIEGTKPTSISSELNQHCPLAIKTTPGCSRCTIVSILGSSFIFKLYAKQLNRPPYHYLPVFSMERLDYNPLSTSL